MMLISSICSLPLVLLLLLQSMRQPTNRGEINGGQHIDGLGQEREPMTEFQECVGHRCSSLRINDLQTLPYLIGRSFYETYQISNPNE
jgi:hypothetical protein